MKLASSAVAILVVASGCTPEGDRTKPSPENTLSPPLSEATRYRVEFDGGGRGVVLLGPDGRACLILRSKTPKAAHLHRASRAGPADGILVTFFEPPARGHSRSCVEADPRAAGFVRDHTRKAYVDLHYNRQDEGVVGTLVPLP